MILLACGLLKEQECDECFEYAQFYKNCAQYLEIESSMILPCFSSDKHIFEECFCNSQDELYPETQSCNYDGAIGAYKSDLDVCSLVDYSISSDECHFADAYQSCRKIKRARKKALNLSDQRKYYKSKSCHRWFWEDRANWQVETAIEKEQCKEFADLFQNEVWLLYGVYPE